MLFWCHLGCLRGLLEHTCVGFGCLLARRRPLLAALAAQIRDGFFFYIFMYKHGVHFLCAGCVDLCPMAFQGEATASYLCAGYADPLKAVFFHVCIYSRSLHFMRRLRGSWPGVILGSPRDWRMRRGRSLIFGNTCGSACGILKTDMLNNGLGRMVPRR